MQDSMKLKSKATSAMKEDVTEVSSWSNAALETLKRRWLECRRVLRTFDDHVTAPCLLRRMPEIEGARYELLPLAKRVVVGKRGDPPFAYPDDRSLSGHHFHLERLPDGRYRAVDLDSTNGLHINGREVHERVLVVGDQIRAGSQEFVYHDGQPTGSKGRASSGLISTTGGRQRGQFRTRNNRNRCPRADRARWGRLADRCAAFVGSRPGRNSRCVPNA